MLKKSLHLLLFFLFVCAFKFSLAQTNNIDSLVKLCSINTAKASRLENYLNLMGQFESMPATQFAQIIAAAKPFVLDANNNRQTLLYEIFRGRYYLSNSKADSAKTIFDSAYLLFSNTPGIEKEILLLRYFQGRILFKQEKYKESIEYMLGLIKQADEKKYYGISCRCYNSIGFAYMLLGRDVDAVKWFQKGIEPVLSKSEDYDRSSIYTNMGSSQNNISNFDSALFYVDEGIKYGKRIQNLTTIANGLNIKSDICLNLKQEFKAEPLLLEALEIRKKIGNADYIASDMVQLSLFYATIKQYDKGLKLAEEAMEIFKKNKITSKLMFAYEAFKLNYKNKGDDKNYAITLEKMLSLKDSLFTLNSAEELASLQTKYEVQKKENINIKQQAEISRKNYLMYGSLILFTLLALIAFTNFRNFRKKQQLKMELAMEQEKKQTELAIRDAAEKERIRIAADLHDNIGVQASAILFGTELLQRKNSGETSVVNNLHNTAKEMMINLRETLWAMKNTDVPVADLWLRIINFSMQMGRHYMHINFTTQGKTPENYILQSPQALNMLMIIQEAVNNAAKHADAKNIIINSIVENKNWIVEIKDDGVGFDMDIATEKNECYGLSKMKERSEVANALFYIDTKKGEGTCVKISFPV